MMSKEKNLPSIERVLGVCRDEAVHTAGELSELSKSESTATVKAAAYFWGAAYWYMCLINAMTEDEYRAIAARLMPRKEGGQDA